MFFLLTYDPHTLKLFLVVDCGDLKPPYGGYRSLPGGTNYQAVATYTCKPQHHLQGKQTRVCQADGKWSGSQPVCLGNYQYCLSAQNFRPIFDFELLCVIIPCLLCSNDVFFIFFCDSYSNITSFPTPIPLHFSRIFC